MQPAIHYPISLRLAGRRVLVVGEGELASARTKLLRDAGANVEVISPHQFTDEHPRGALLVFACASRDENRRIAQVARTQGSLVNAHDDAECSDFAIPAVIVRGPLVISVSTSGESPSVAARIRRDLDTKFGDEVTRFVRIVAAARRCIAPNERAAKLRALVDSPLLDCLRAEDRAGCDAAIRAALGDQITLAGLES